MFYRQIVVLILLILSFCNYAKLVASSDVVKIESLDQIEDVDPTGTLYLFNITDTLIDSPNMLGSRAWRKYIRQATKYDDSQNWHDIFSLFLARNYPINPVEKRTKQVVKDLQGKGAVVCCLTGRERKMWYDIPIEDIDQLTLQQLKGVGIEPSDDCLRNTFPELAYSRTYFKGVFFSNESTKGKYLEKLLKASGCCPKRIIVIDDKNDDIQEIAKVLNELKIPATCYWYMGAEKRKGDFDPLIANIQLYYFWLSGGEKIVSDSEALEIVEEYPERDAEYYLKIVLQVAKTVK